MITVRASIYVQFAGKRSVRIKSRRITYPKALFGNESALQRIEKKLDTIALEMKTLKKDFAGLQGVVTGAVAINAGAYLGPIFAFIALGNAVGFFDKLK